MQQGAHMMKSELMQFNEMDGPVFKIAKDPRVTRVGRIIRKFSIDEFPQFINVLIGQMSIVGPRPLVSDEIDECHSEVREKRLSVKPGITCYWQTGGRNNISSFDEWMKLDMMYIEDMSLAVDLFLILKTVPAVLSSDGAS
jgi:lipopolysaccharide/colanic/teichoic acid biosynthesis glycosyltransferase